MLKGWTYYHLTLVGLFITGLILIAVNALLALRVGSFETKAEIELPYDPELVWTWVVDNNKRDKWQVTVDGVSRLRGDITELGSTRMLFMRLGKDRWNGVEKTVEIEFPVRWKAVQNYQHEQKIYEVLLSELGECHTRVTLKSSTVQYEYVDRFWLFWNFSTYQDRMNLTLNQLEKWMSNTEEKCTVRSS